MATLKSGLGELFDHVGATKQWDSDENHHLNDYAAQAAHSFIHEYSVEENRDNPMDVQDAIADEIHMAVQENVSRSMWEHYGNEAVNAIERMASDARVPLTAKFDKKRGTVTATFDGKAMLRAWQEAVDGMGYTSFTDEKISDIKSLRGLVSILDDHAEVYGTKSFKRILGEDDRYEPDTGSYSQLAKIADKALRQSRGGR